MTLAATGLPGGSVVKKKKKIPLASAGDMGLVPGLGKYPGEGNGNTLQYSSWRIPWTEEPRGLQFMGLQSWTQLSTHARALATTT